jgi:hypothetical protein
MPRRKTTKPDDLTGLPEGIGQPGVLSAACAPVALFVYNRPEHTRQTLEHLRANHLAGLTHLFVFADGPKDKTAVVQVGAVRKLIHSIDGFKSITIIERDRNLGLSASIIAGVTQLCSEYGRAIVVEDDVLTAKDFLGFLNLALDQYSNEQTVFSIGAFNFPIPAPSAYAYDAFFSYRFMCWGWGTWRDRWEKADWSVKDYPEFAADPERQKRFNRGGNDCSWLLARHMAGKIDSWDTVWAYTHSKHNAVTLLPVVSKVHNIGFDGSGTHCRRSPFAQASLAQSFVSDNRLPDSVDVDPYFASQIQRLRDRSLPKKFAQYIRDGFIPRRKRGIQNPVGSDETVFRQRPLGTRID